MERARRVRLFRLAALAVVLFGGGFAFLTGTWRDGALGLSISLALALFGLGELARDEDRAVALTITIVGSLGVLGHLAQIFLL